MESLKGLLTNMLARHQITKQVTTARIIEEANVAIAALLPAGRGGDATAVSVREGTVAVSCRNAGAAGFLRERELAILDAIKRALPDAQVYRVRTKIVSGILSP